MNNVDKAFKNADKKPSEYSKLYIDYLCEVLKNIDHNAVEKFINLMVECREKGTKIIFAGNGGSAATASHFANDIGYGTRTYDKPFRALSLTDNNAVMTAVGNDDGYEDIFLKQLQVTMSPGDLVVLISASGNSPNVVKAAEYVKSKGNHVVGLTGFDGGKLRALSDTVIHIDTPAKEYGPVEDAHMVIDHLVGNYLLRLVKES